MRGRMGPVPYNKQRLNWASCHSNSFLCYPRKMWETEKKTKDFTTLFIGCFQAWKSWQGKVGGKAEEGSNWSQENRSIGSVRVLCYGSEKAVIFLIQYWVLGKSGFVSNPQIAQIPKVLPKYPNTQNAQSGIIIMVPVFQMRKLRLRDMIKVTQLKTLGSKVQTQGLGPQILCFCSAPSGESWH